KADKLMEQAYDPQRQLYTQAIGNKNLDASTLAMITMNYLGHNSDKAKQHIAALEKELLAEHGLFYRYKHTDDFGFPESTFLVCAFWYIDALACVGRTEDAIQNMEK